MIEQVGCDDGGANAAFAGGARSDELANDALAERILEHALEARDGEVLAVDAEIVDAVVEDLGRFGGDVGDARTAARENFHQNMKHVDHILCVDAMMMIVIVIVMIAAAITI